MPVKKIKILCVISQRNFTKVEMQNNENVTAVIHKIKGFLIL